MSDPQTTTSERYELGELFEDMSPETELVYKAIGTVLTLVVLGLALTIPFRVGHSDHGHSGEGGHAHPHGQSAPHADEEGDEGGADAEADAPEDASAAEGESSAAGGDAGGETNPQDGSDGEGEPVQ